MRACSGPAVVLARAGRMARADCVTVAFVPQSHAPFALFNRTANPVVTAVLSSPLHPLLSGGLALITVTGRRSGRRYTFPVGYRQVGDRVTINVGWPGSKRWWRNLREGGPVEMRIRGRRRAGRAQAQGDERSGVKVEVQLDPDRAC
jgi:F420H(2)-dependent quinone reductase